MPPTKPTSTPVSKLLADFRQRSGLSFDQLAERSNLNISYLHALESGKRSRPSRDVLLRIAHGLGLETHEIDELLIAGKHLPLFTKDDTV